MSRVAERADVANVYIITGAVANSQPVIFQIMSKGPTIVA